MGDHRRTPHVLRAACGLVGPAMFTTAWLVNGMRQPRYPVVDEHISGLAALDAEHPISMIAGFVTLGSCSVVFATELWRLLAEGRRRPGLGPVLLGLGGVASVAAGFLRRDAFLLSPPGRDPAYRQSWHNDGHDLAAAVIYATSVLAPLFLARRFRKDPAWAPLVPVALASSGASVVLMAIFATDVDRSYNGIVQRVMVTVPQAFMAALAVRALRSPTGAATVPARPRR
jgi:hypothetical protein